MKTLQTEILHYNPHEIERGKGSEFPYQLGEKNIKIMQEALQHPDFKNLPQDFIFDKNNQYSHPSLVSLLVELRDFLYEKYGDLFVHNAKLSYTLNSTYEGESRTGETSLPHTDFSADTLANCYNNYRPFGRVILLEANKTAKEYYPTEQLLTTVYKGNMYRRDRTQESQFFHTYKTSETSIKKQLEADTPYWMTSFCVHQSPTITECIHSARRSIFLLDVEFPETLYQQKYESRSLMLK